MKPFGALSARGRLRRLRRMAEAALAAFGVEAERMTLLGSFTNTLYRVRTVAGRAYVLRICAPGWRTETDLRSEALWLEALARDTQIGAPVPQRTPGGEAVIGVHVDGVPATCFCTLMTWIPGVNLGERLSVETLTQMGQLFAAMHAHGADFAPPPGFTTRRMSHYLARGEQDTLFAPACVAALPARDRAALEATRDRVAAAFAARYADPEGLRVIHNDLWHDNIKVNRGRLRPLDFEDTLWGYPVQDIAMAFEDLRTEGPSGCYAAFMEAFRTGYERSAPWPERYEGEIDAFQAGRMLWVANYVATHEAPHLNDFLARLTPRLESYLETGRVTPRGPA